MSAFDQAFGGSPGIRSIYLNNMNLDKKEAYGLSPDASTYGIQNRATDEVWDAANTGLEDGQFILGIIARAEVDYTGSNIEAVPGYNENCVIPRQSGKKPMTVMDFEAECLRAEQKIFELSILAQATAKLAEDKKLEKTPFDKA